MRLSGILGVQAGIKCSECGRKQTYLEMVEERRKQERQNGERDVRWLIRCEEPASTTTKSKGRSQGCGTREFVVSIACTHQQNFQRRREQQIQRQNLSEVE